MIISKLLYAWNYLNQTIFCELSGSTRRSAGEGSKVCSNHKRIE
jgi:hypothetical protein